jgi:hypothetical protein
MNTLKIIVVIGLSVLFNAEQASAQLLREIKNRAIERSKDVIVGKTADKAAEKTGQAMDKLLNPDLGGLMNRSGKKIDMADLPDYYRFDYLYALKMTTKEGEILFNYYLNPNEPYMGAKINMGMDMSMVFDEGNNVLLTFVNGMPIATEMDSGEGFDEDELDLYNDYTITELPNREFLGYDCIGRQMENDEYKFIVYLAPNMEAGFGNVFKSDRANLPPAMQKMSEEYENGLMMYMEMVDKKNKKRKNTSATMECVAFEPSDLVIYTRN